MRIESYPPEAAAEVAQAHLELNTDHIVVTYVCGGCGQPIGVICSTCREPLCAVDTADCEHAR